MNFFSRGNAPTTAGAGIVNPAVGTTSSDQDVFKGFSFTKDEEIDDKMTNEAD